LKNKTKEAKNENDEFRTTMQKHRSLPSFAYIYAYIARIIDVFFANDGRDTVAFGHAETKGLIGFRLSPC